MKIQLFRHATCLLEFAGQKILLDPMLSEAGAMPAIPDVPDFRDNPLVALPVSWQQEALTTLDAILVTHLHRDHFDEAAAALLPKTLPIFCQPADTSRLQAYGFIDVRPIATSRVWQGITFSRTEGQHGLGEIGRQMAPVAGFVVAAPAEKDLYIPGDTVWCPEVEAALQQYQPEVVLCFAGGAEFNAGGPITMTAQDLGRVCCKLPQAAVVAVHMEAWNHCRLTRAALKEFAVSSKLAEQVFIPENGEVLLF